MSGAIRLPPEIEELFGYTDGDGLLDPEDLKEAGFSYQQEVDDIEIWEKENTVVRYSPEKRSIENYNQLK